MDIIIPDNEWHNAMLTVYGSVSSIPQKAMDRFRQNFLDQ